MTHSIQFENNVAKTILKFLKFTNTGSADLIWQGMVVV